MSEEKKIHTNICISGTIDAGKSTLTGHLCFKLGALDNRTLQKLQDKANELGKGSFSFAFFTDTTKEEQARGITIQSTTKQFFTKKYAISVVDCPGHRDFLKNMITGSAQVESAVLLCPADSNFTAAIQKADPGNNVVEGQTRAHSRILNALGIKQLIVIINKMDEKSVNYSKDRFMEVSEEMKNVLIKTGWKKEFVEKSVPILPLSAWAGDNLTEPTTNMPWWEGTTVTNLEGQTVKIMTMLDALDNYICMPPPDVTKPVRIPLSHIYNIPGIGQVFAGKVEQGQIKPGDDFMLVPKHLPTNPQLGRVFTVEMHHTQMPAAIAGDNVGINIKKDKKSDLRAEPGDVMVLASDPIKGVLEFRAVLQVIDTANEIKVGYTPIACIRTQKQPIKLSKIIWKMGKETGGKKMEDPPSIKTGETAEVIFSCTRPICVEPFAQCEGLGRVICLEGNALSFVAKVMEITKTTY